MGSVLSRGLGGKARIMMEAIENEGFVDLRRAAEVFNGKPPGFYTKRDMTFDIKDATTIYQTLERLEVRGLVAVPLHLRPREWHLVSWHGRVPTIDPKKGKVVEMSLKHPDRPLFLRTMGQIWETPNPVVRVTAWRLAPVPS